MQSKLHPIHVDGFFFHSWQNKKHCEEGLTALQHYTTKHCTPLTNNLPGPFISTEEAPTKEEIVLRAPRHLGPHRTSPRHHPHHSVKRSLRAEVLNSREESQNWGVNAFHHSNLHTAINNNNKWSVQREDRLCVLQ